MNERTAIRPQEASSSRFVHVRTGLMQRRCACGGTPGLDGECASCRKKRLALQRSAVDQTIPTTVPPVVHEVLRSPGRPLDPYTRASMEAHFGHDFGRVRVHDDARAAESAQGVRALAYTAGQDVVFGAGRYAPETDRGRRLLAHELTHVVQQQQPYPGRGASGMDLEGEADAAGVRVTAGGPVSVVGMARPGTIQKQQALPPAVVTAESADVFDEPRVDAGKQATLKRGDAVEEVVDKREVKKGVWWYKIRYKVGSTERTGWSPGENFSEVASPDKFKFEQESSTGWTGPYGTLQEAVIEGGLEPKVARLINFMNIVVLPAPGLTLPDFVSQSFYHALVSAKGNFKQASLLMTAALRALKPSKKGKFPWVQSKATPSSEFDPSTFRDKIWHFFWNAYERFGGAWFPWYTWIDFWGVMYEAKRHIPEGRLELEQDDKEDIVFNRGGNQFAGWVMENMEAVISAVFAEVAAELRAAIARDPEMSKMPKDKIDEAIRRAMTESKEIKVEIEKRCYAVFADYAGKYVRLVLDAIKTMKGAGAPPKEAKRGETPRPAEPKQAVPESFPVEDRASVWNEIDGIIARLQAVAWETAPILTDETNNCAETIRVANESLRPARDTICQDRESSAQGASVCDNEIYNCADIGVTRRLLVNALDELELSGPLQLRYCPDDDMRARIGEETRNIERVITRLIKLCERYPSYVE